MTYSVCNQLKIYVSGVWLLASVLVTSACTPLQPSGGRKPVVEDPQTEENPPVIPLNPNEQKPTDELSSLEVTISITLKDSIFSEKVLPVLQGCTANGCHSMPEVINLRTFPFSAEGSYALDDIKARLGQTPDPHAVQLELVKVLIDSMKTMYMPPAPADPVSSDTISAFETWQASGLEQTKKQFNGSFQIIAKDEAGIDLCSLQGNIENGSFNGKIGRKNCEDAAIVSYQIFDAEKRIVGTGDIKGGDFLKLGTWVIQVETQ